MLPIRPLPSIAPPAPVARPRSAEALAAQRAFFAQALGKTAPAEAPVIAAKIAAPPAPAAPTVQAADNTDEPTIRYARPGSRLDIKV